MSGRLLSRARSLLIGLLVTMQGCSVIPQINVTPHYYPRCVQPFAALERAQQDLLKKTALGAALVGTGGALTGAAISGDWRGALIGLGVGMVAGAVAGFTYAKFHQIRDRKQRMLAYRGAVAGDLSACNEVQLAAYESLRCYMEEFQALLTDYKSQSLPREEFSARYDEIRTGLREIGRIVAEARIEMEKNDADFRQALSTDPENAAQTLPAPALRKPTPVVPPRRPVKPAPSVKPVQPAKPVQTPPTDTSPLQTLLVSVDDNMEAANARQDSLAEDRLALVEARSQETTKSSTTTTVRGQSLRRPAPAKSPTPKTAPPEADTLETVVREYGDGYARAAAQLEEVQQLNQEAMLIMADAAGKAGLDMVDRGGTWLADTSSSLPSGPGRLCGTFPSRITYGARGTIGLRTVGTHPSLQP